MEKKIYSNQIKIGDNLSDEIFAVKNFKKAITKDGKPYADLTLSDKTGQVKAKIWSEGLQVSDELKEGDVARIFGKVGEFNKQPQIVISSAIKTEEYDLSDFIACCEHDIDEMKAQIQGYINEIQNPHLKKLLENIFSGISFETYCKAPAAYTVHHAYSGGMADHTLDILVSADALMKRYPNLNKDLLYTGIILHDFGKLMEYETGTTITMSTEGKLLGHVYMGASYIQNAAPKDMPKDLLDELVHMILSHQRLMEFGSPVLPKTPEAITLAYLDDTSAKLNTIYYTIKNSEAEGLFTDYQRHLGTDLYKSPYHGDNI